MIIDKTKLSQFTYEDKTYNLFIIKKRIRNIIARYRDGVIVISVPLFLTSNEIADHLKKILPRYIKSRLKNKEEPYSFDNQFLYIFGERYTLLVGEKNKINDDVVVVKDEVNLKRMLKKRLLAYLSESVTRYSAKMGMPLDKYKVRVRDMKTRYGTNSQKTMCLTFQLGLVHFPKEVIDTVVVHELAHDKYHDHSKNFYNYVLNTHLTIRNYKKD